MTLPSVLRPPITVLRRAIRRHRRVVAAGLAGVGLLLALSAVRGAPTVDATGLPVIDGSAGPHAGEVAVPVTLASGAIASTLEAGDVVDLVAIDEAGTAAVVASRVRVLELTSGGGALSATSAAVVIVAVAESRALPVTAASATGGLSVLIRAG